MYRKLSVLLPALVLILAFASAQAFSGTPTEKEWTLLVYLNGNNNLDSFGKKNIKQMEKIGSTDKVNIVVQWASLANKGTKRLLITKNTTSPDVASPVVQEMGQVDMGDYRSLTEFIQWGAANYPAKHYFVDVWDHGSGWHAIDGKPHGGVHLEDISWDDLTHHAITTLQLGTAIKDAARAINHKIDIYGSDACLMGMAEVAAEMKDAVDVYVGSQELEPGEGWPYDAVLNRWNALTGATAAQVGKILVEEYVKSYQGGSNGTKQVTFAAYDMAKIDRFNSAVAALGTELSKLDRTARTKAVTAFTTAQTYYYKDYRDLGDFVDLLEKSGIPAFNKTSLAGIRGALSEFVISNKATVNYAKSHGVSLWMPGNLRAYSSFSNLYNALSFQSATRWGSMLQYVLQDATAP